MGNRKNRNKNKSRTKAYQRGWSDAESGRDYHNPYPANTRQANDYTRGYDDYSGYDLVTPLRE